MITTYNASDARQNLYQLIKTVANGIIPIEINLRDTEPVMMVSKADYEGWLETLDILSSPEEIRAVRKGIKSKKTTSLSKLKQELGI